MLAKVFQLTTLWLIYHRERACPYRDGVTYPPVGASLLARVVNDNADDLGQSASP